MKACFRVQKVIALIVIIAMILTSVLTGLVPVYAAAGPGDGQVEFVGGGNKATGNYYIETSKTIRAVDGKENYFDVTLQVKTKRHHVEMSSDVVLVLDISNTMNSDKDGNYSADDAKKKLTQAKKATNQFIDDFVNNQNLDTNRRLAVVTFNSDAAVAAPLTQANDSGDAKNLKNKVNAITAPGFNSTRRFTNVEAGLQLAMNILNQQSNAKFKYIVLLTDGFPTTYIQGNRTSTSSITGYDVYMPGGYNDAKTSQDGYFANTRTKEPCTGGTSYSNKGAKKAEAVAASAKNAGINIFSVGIALASQNINKFLTYVVDTTGMKSSDAYAIGNTEKTYKSWLQNKIAGGTMLTNSKNLYADAYNQTELENSYTQILQDIERAPEIANRDFFTIDPMSKVADFIGFYNKNGKLVGDTLNGQSKENGEDTAVYGKSYGGQSNQDTIYWDKMKSGFQTQSDGTLVFDLKYRVRLKNEISGFQWEKALETNETTSLHYAQKYVESGTDVPGGSGTLDYQIPKVEGYRGALNFQKVDSETKAPLSGVKFTLRHHGDSCDVCNGDAPVADITATSKADGEVAFRNIPSGHEYILIETTPEGYAPLHNHEVIVAYGDTYIGAKKEENKLVNGKLNGTAFIVENKKIDPVEVRLQVAKTMDGQPAEEGLYSFLLKGTEQHQGTHHEYAKNQLDPVSGKSLATFEPLIFDNLGTYEYSITEVPGDDSTTVYDNKEHKISFVVTKSADGRKYIAKASVNGVAAETFEGSNRAIYVLSAGEFANKTRKEGSIVLKADKEMLDKNGQPVALQGGAFSFTLKDYQGNVLQTVTNQADGSVIFDQANTTYTTAGTYKYTMEEVYGDDSSISYDTREYEILVTVSASDPYQESYTVEAEYQLEGERVAAAEFVNKERKTPTLEVIGLKTLNGKPADSQTFIFQHIELDDDGNEIAGTERILQNDDNGLLYFDFSELVDQMIEEYDAGHRKFHDFRLYEVKTKDAIDGEKIVYDETYYELFLAVDAPVGHDAYTLSAYLYRISGDERTTVFYSDQSDYIRIEKEGDTYPIHFDNASSREVVLKGTKQFLSKEGEVIALHDGQFAFTLQDAAGNVVQTVRNQEDGTFTFDPLTFTGTDAGNHKYVIFEDTPYDEKTENVYYDETVYTVDFEVKTDEHGRLSITEPVIEKSGEPAEAIAFVNKEMNESQLQISVKKTVNGKTPDIMKKFDFQLKTVEAPAGVDVNKAPLQQMVQNIEGHGAFELIAFEKLKAGRYVFEISEMIPAEAALIDGKYVYNKMTYDPTVHQVVVDVTKTADLVEKTVTVNGDVLETDQVQLQVDFDNQYDPDPAKVALKAKKTLTGRDMKASEFEFELLDEQGKVLQTKTNQAAEAGVADVIAFDELVFDKTGAFVYMIKEKQGALGGVKYDDKVYRVTVNVKDDNRGKLYAEILVNDTLMEEGQLLQDVMHFENAYQTKDAFVQLVGRKTLEGRALVRKEFRFKLYQVNEEGKELLQTIENGSIERNNIGSIAFGILRFTEPGSYTYEIKEVLGNAVGVSYDERVYGVIVHVADDGAGNLTADVDYTLNGAPATEILFENSYKLEPSDSETPDTGDHNNMMLWLMLFTVSGTAMAGTIVFKRRRNDE